MPQERESRKIFHGLFEISIVLKGVFGAFEIILGVVVLFFRHTVVKYFLLYFVQGELNENPRDWIVNQALHLSQHITPSSDLFMGIYFLLDGIVKLILIVGLLLNREWAYPTAIIFMTLFIGYGIYRFDHTHSPILLFLSALDALTIFLVWHEYSVRQAKRVR